MNLLPPPGPQRRRQLTMLAVVGLVLAIVAWRYTPWRTTAAVKQPTSNVQERTAAPQSAASGQSSKPAPSALMPQAVNLDKLEPVPDEPGAGRNLFRYGVRALPPPPPPPPPPPTPQVVQGPPPQPPGPPPIELQLKGVIKRPEGSTIVVLRDPKTDALLRGVEGEVLDGKYKILKVGETSVIVSYVDGTGQRTIRIG